MALDYSQLNQLVVNPTESLSLELKDWIDPDSPEGKSKIVKASIAMRNNDGGYLLIGFRNGDGSPNLEGGPDDVLSVFHIDKIQGLISRYSSEPFEIAVYYPEIENKRFVVIESPSGVKVPVATKSGLHVDGSDYLRSDRVIVRSMNSNNTPSTTEAKWKDWPMIVEKCFENREADVGRFLRRHLMSVSSEHLKGFFESLGHNIQTATPSLVDFLDISYQRFCTLKSERKLTFPEHGSMEVAVSVNGCVNELSTNGDFLNLLSATNPGYTGWPVWVDSRSFSDQSSKPFVYDGYWEALIASIGRNFGDHLDYWRVSPEGKFYLYRGLQDDIGGGDRSPEPCTVMDFTLMILRVAECVVVATEFAKSLGAEESGVVSFAFRWNGLKGRSLSSWANPNRMLSWAPEAYQDSIMTEIDIPVDTAKSAFSGYIQQIINPLFQVFNGFDISETVTEDLVRRLVERRL